ncbi:hypothetical protein [Bacteroides sp.]|uniref:hypothetical protein n=1 Tax=Bacteroides sp. TaxID=29523 RepID=UPI0025C47652|nr:hypothetical protein [Bacteroides sp.]
MNNVSQKKELPVYDFLKGRLTQTRALNTLEKRIRYNDDVCHYYEMIESFPAGLTPQQEQIYSSKAESGHVTKWVIGNHICNYKVEVDYYLYLAKGGRKYSDYLAEVNAVEEHNSEVDRLARQAQDEKERIEHQQEKENSIRIALTHTVHQYIEMYIGQASRKLAEHKKEKQTKFIKDEITYYEQLIPQRTALAVSTHTVTNRIYRLNGDAIEQVYTYEIGSNVRFYQRGKTYITTVEKTSENRFGETTYLLKKVEDMVNPYSGYNALLPAEEEPYEEFID